MFKIFFGCKSFHESNSPNILAPCETNLDDSVGTGSFSVGGNLPLVWKDSVTHMLGLAVDRKEWLPFGQDLYLGNSVQILIYVFE